MSIYPSLTKLTREILRAQTHKPVCVVRHHFANPAIQARLFGARICVQRTVVSGVPHRAPALIMINQIDANLPRLTPNPHAIVNVNLAMGPREARLAVASKVMLVWGRYTRGIVKAGLQFASVIRDIAKRAHPLFRAVAGDSVGLFDARAAIQARLRNAIVGFRFALLT